MCPASRFQAVSGLSRSSRSRSLVLYRSFARASSPPRWCICECIACSHTHRACVSLSPTDFCWKIRADLTCVRVGARTYAWIRYISYAAFDRTQLNCGYKSMKPYAPRAFQRAFAKLRTKPASYIFRQRAKYDLSSPVACALLFPLVTYFYVSDLRKSSHRLASERVERESAQDEILFSAV